LIFVTLLFALLGSLNLYSFNENFTDISECTGRVVPACSTDLDDVDLSDELQYYALKTELVPPICPNCPYYEDISFGRYHNSPDDDVSSGTLKIKGNNNNNTNSTDVNIGNKTSVDQSTNVNSTTDFNNNQEDNSSISQDNSISEKNNTNTEQNVTQDNRQDNSVKEDNSVKQSADSKWNNLFGNNSISFGGGGKNNSTIQTTGNNSQSSMGGSNSGTGQGTGPVPVNSASSNPFMLQQGTYLQGPDIETTNMINSLKQKVDMLMKEKPSTITETQFGNYPSSFACSQPPNYRSSGNIPLPILNDFSSF